MENKTQMEKVKPAKRKLTSEILFLETGTEERVKNTQHLAGDPACLVN